MKNLVLGLLVVAATSACTDDFEQLNTNPNAPVDVQPQLLLRQVIFNFQEGLSYEGFTGGANLGQYLSADPGFNAFDRGDLLAPQFGGNPWPLHYNNLRDIQIVLDKSRAQPVNAVYEGPALVMKSYIAASLTDIFGDVPYSEAVSGRDGAVAPAYDRQEDIYLGEEGLLANLRLAVDVMDGYQGAVRLAGDVLFDGDMSQWTAFANSLRLKLLLRASAKLTDAQLAEMQDIFADERYLGADGPSDATFRFGGAPNDFRYARARLGDFTNYLMSLTIDSTLNALSDPREQLYFRENSLGGYAGVINGIGPGTGYNADTVSLPGLIWRENADRLQGNYMTRWETDFIIAEAAVKGYIDADANEYYRRGVQQAFEYWETSLPSEYLAEGPASFNEDDTEAALEQIATQRWIASIGHGYEGWIEWRRTGYPKFYQPASSLNGGLIPVRFPYPANEQALNEASFNEAVSRLEGGNDANARVWWDR